MDWDGARQQVIPLPSQNSQPVRPILSGRILRRGLEFCSRLPESQMGTFCLANYTSSLTAGRPLGRVTFTSARSKKSLGEKVGK